MKIKILIAALMISFCAGTAFAQLYETRSYDLTAYKEPAKLSATEAAKPVVILAEKKHYEFIYKDESELVQYYTFHRHVRINESAAVERYNKIYLPVSNPSDLLSLKLRSVNKAGKIREMYKGDLKKITEDGNDFLILAVEGLEKDSELEYFYTVRRGPSYFLTDYVQSSVYTRLTEIRIITPANLIYDFKAYNGKVASTDTTIEEKRFLTIRCDSVPDLDSEERYAFYNANRLRIESKLSKNLSGKSGRLFTWADAGTRFYEIMHEEEKSAAKDIQKLASSLGLKKMSSPEDQIRAVENYMKTNINNKSDEEKPTIPNMLKKNYGGENQITALYVLMFEYLGIPHEFVLTTPKSDTWFDPDFDTWNFLDDYLIHFPSTGKFLAPVNYLYRYGNTPYQFSGNNGLFVKKYSLGDVSNALSAVKKIGASGEKDNFDNIKADITFENKFEDVKVSFTRDFGGHADNNIRAIYFYSDEDGRDKIVNDLLSSSFKEIKSRNAKMTNYDMEKDYQQTPLRLEGSVVTNSLIENAGENIVFSIGMVIGEQAEMYQDHLRQNPIAIDYPHSYKRIITVTIPEGYTLSGAEKLNMNVSADELGIGFISKYEITGNKLTVTVDEYYKQTEYPVAVYEKFRGVINAAADFNKIKILFTKS